MSEDPCLICRTARKEVPAIQAELFRSGSTTLLAHEAAALCKEIVQFVASDPGFKVKTYRLTVEAIGVFEPE